MVRISRRAASGRQQVISFMLPGDIFGQIPEAGLYVNSATAMGQTRLYRVRLSQLEDLLRDEPQLQSSFLVRMAFDLRQAQKRILVLGQQNVSQRLASFLLDLMEHEDFYDPQRKQLSLPLSRFDLADYLGTSPETVVRVLARLEKDGLIRRLSARLLLIPSPDALARLLRGRRRND
jgi:CRP-like cAMP-binding protein